MSGKRYYKKFHLTVEEIEAKNTRDFILNIAKQYEVRVGIKNQHIKDGIVEVRVKFNGHKRAVTGFLNRLRQYKSSLYPD